MNTVSTKTYVFFRNDNGEVRSEEVESRDLTNLVIPDDTSEFGFYDQTRVVQSDGTTFVGEDFNVSPVFSFLNDSKP